MNQLQVMQRVAEVTKELLQERRDTRAGLVAILLACGGEVEIPDLAFVQSYDDYMLYSEYDPFKMVTRLKVRKIPSSSSGRTPEFDSGNRGSNP